MSDPLDDIRRAAQVAVLRRLVKNLERSGATDSLRSIARMNDAELEVLASHEGDA